MKSTVASRLAVTDDASLRYAARLDSLPLAVHADAPNTSHAGGWRGGFKSENGSVRPVRIWQSKHAETYLRVQVPS